MSLRQIINERGAKTKLSDLKNLTHLKFTWGKHAK